METFESLESEKGYDSFKIEEKSKSRFSGISKGLSQPWYNYHLGKGP